MSSESPRRRRHSPAVYRRRRLVALLLALIVIGGIVAGVWALIAQPWSDGSAPAPSPSSSASGSVPVSPTPEAADDADQSEDATDEADPEASAEAAATCTAGDVSVDPVTNQDAYASGENPQLSIRLTNTSDADCTINVGTSAQSFTITSGSDTWWRSTDCQSEPSDMVVTLAAGQSVESAEPIEWDRTRSSVDTCDGDRQSAPGGGATYNLAVEIGGISSAGSTSFMLY